MNNENLNNLESNNSEQQLDIQVDKDKQVIENDSTQPDQVSNETEALESNKLFEPNENNSSIEPDNIEPQQATEESEVMEPLQETEVAPKSEFNLFRGEGRNYSHQDERDEQIDFAERWCDIDEEGNIRQKSGSLFEGKVIGKLYSKHSKSTLKKYLIKFNEISDKVATAIEEFKRSSNKLPFYGKIKSLEEAVNFSFGLGDYNSLLVRLKEIEEDIIRLMEENLIKKEELVKKAEELKDSTDWKNTSEKLKKLQEEWKRIGPVAPDRSDEVWDQFRGAIDVFFNNRQKFFDLRRVEEENNLLAKQKLCEEVEKLLENEDLIAATKRVKEIQIEWNKLGLVPRQYTDLIWQRFREACDQIFNSLREERSKKKEEFKFRTEERKKRLSEVLLRYKEKEKNLVASIDRDNENIERWQEMISRVKTSDSSTDFKKNLDEKIKDVQDKIDTKKSRLKEIAAEIQDLESKIED